MGEFLCHHTNLFPALCMQFDVAPCRSCACSAALESSSLGVHEINCIWGFAVSSSACLILLSLSLSVSLLSSLSLRGKGAPLWTRHWPVLGRASCPPLRSSDCYWLVDTMFAPRDTVLSRNRTAPRVALPSLGMGSWGTSLVASGAHKFGSCSCRFGATEAV